MAARFAPAMAAPLGRALAAAAAARGGARCAASAAAAAAAKAERVRAEAGAPPEVRLPNTGAMINNAWVMPAGAPTLTTLNPATEEPIADVISSGKDEIEAAVRAARDAFAHGTPWRAMGGYGRATLLNRLADLMKRDEEELAMLDMLDNGKPYAEAKLDAKFSRQCFRYYAAKAHGEHAQLVRPSGPVVASDTLAFVEKEPVGVVGAIVPWNFPQTTAAWKLSPALAAGCTVVLKTAPQTPLSANKMAELIIEAGFPPGVVNVLPGDDEAGKMLVAHDDLDKIAFTGSTAVGTEVRKACAETPRFRRVSLELGGKSPLIVTEHADIAKAVEVAQVGLFLNAGQCCCASSRIFVEASKYDEFCEKAARMAESRPVVPGWHPAAQTLDASAWPQGPQVDRTQLESVLGYIAAGKREGATVLAGGSRFGSQGFFIEPTVFADVSDEMTIAQEEIFGPVMQVLKYDDDDEVIARANATDYGLAAGTRVGRSCVDRRVRAHCSSMFRLRWPPGQSRCVGAQEEFPQAIVHFSMRAQC